MWDVTNLYGGYIVIITTTVAAVVTITILVVTYRCYRLRKLQLQDISNKKTTIGTRGNKSTQKKSPELERKSSNLQAQKSTSISNYSPKHIASRRDDVSSSSSGRRKKRKKARAGIEKDDDGTEDAVDKSPDDDPLSEVDIIRDDKRVSNTRTETQQQVNYGETSNEIALDDAITEMVEITNGNTVHTPRLSEKSLSERVKTNGKSRVDHEEEVGTQDVSETYKPTEDASSFHVDIIRGDRRVSKTSTETIQQLIHVEATHIGTFDIPEAEEMIISENGHSTHNLKASDNSIDFLRGGPSTSLITNSPSCGSISKLDEDSKLEPPKFRSGQKKAKKFADISVSPHAHKSDLLKSGLDDKEKAVRNEKNEEILTNSRKNSKSPSNITKATKNLVDGTATKANVTFIRNEIWEKKTPLPIDGKIGPNSQNRETEKSENRSKEINLASNSPDPVNGNIFPAREVAVHLNKALEQKNVDQLPCEPVSSKKTGKMKNRNKTKFTTMEVNTSAIKIIGDITDRNVTPVFRVSDAKEEKNHLNKDTDAIQHDTDKSTSALNEIQEERSDDNASWQQSKITKNDPTEDKENTFVEQVLNHSIRISTDTNGELKNGGKELAETTAITKPHQSDNITKQKEKKIDITRIKTNNNESVLIPEASCHYVDYESTVKASAKETNKSQFGSQDNSVDSLSSSNKQKEAISTKVPKAVRLPGRHRNENSHHIAKHANATVYQSFQDGAHEVLSDEATAENAVPPSSISNRAAQYQLPNEDDSASPSWKLEQGNAYTNEANMHSGTKKKNESTPVFTGPKYSAGRVVCTDQEKALTDTSVSQREISPERNMEPKECNENVTSPLPIPTKKLVKHLHETESAYPTTPIQREVTKENQSYGSKIVELSRTQVARVELPCKVTKSTDESFPVLDSRTTSHLTSTFKPTESESNSTEKLNRRAQLDEKPVFFMTTSTELKPSASKTKQKAKGLIGKKNKSLVKKEEVYSKKNNERNIPSTMHSTTDVGHEPNIDNMKREYWESDSPLASSTMKKPLLPAHNLVVKQNETNDTQLFTTKDDGRENAELNRKQYQTLNTEPYSTHAESNNTSLPGPKKPSQKSPLLTGAQGEQDTCLGTEERQNSSKQPQAAPDLVAEQSETNDTQSFISKDDSGEKVQPKRGKSLTMNKEPYSIHAESNNTPLPGPKSKPSKKSSLLTGAQGKQDTCLGTVERLKSDFDGAVTKSTDDRIMEVNSNRSKQNARADVLGSTKTSQDDLTIADASQNRLSIAGVETENLPRQKHKLKDKTSPQVLDNVEVNEKLHALTDDRQITQTQNAEHEHFTAMVNSRMENIDFTDRFVNTDHKDDQSKLIVDLNEGKDSKSDEFRAKTDSLDRQEKQINSQYNFDSETTSPTTVVDRMDSPTTTVRQVEAQWTSSEEITPVNVTERSSRREFLELRAKPIPTETSLNPALENELLSPQPGDANSYHINWTGAKENQSEQYIPEARKIDNLFGEKQDKTKSVYGAPLDREYKQSEASSVNQPTKSPENWRMLDTHSPLAKDHKINPTERSENNNETIPSEEKKCLADDNRGKCKYENRQTNTEAQLSLKSNHLLKNETEVAPKEYKEKNLYTKAVPENQSLETRSQRMPLETKSHQLSSQKVWSSHEECSVHKGMTEHETEKTPSPPVETHGAHNTASKAIRVRNKPVQFEPVINRRSESHTQSFIQPCTVDEDEEYSLKAEDKPDELQILGENKLIQDDSAASVDQTEEITKNTDIPETTQVSTDSPFTAKNSPANDHTPEALSSLFGEVDGEHKSDEIDEAKPNQPIIHDNQMNPLLSDADIPAKNHLKGTRNPADHTRIIPNDSLPHIILHERDVEIDATGQTLMDDKFTEQIDGHILSDKKSNEHEFDEDKKTHFDNVPEHSKDNKCPLNLGIKPETTSTSSSECQQDNTVVKINREQNLNVDHKVLSDVKEPMSHQIFSNKKNGEETIAERALRITDESTPLGIHSDPEQSVVNSQCENFENQNIHERAGSDFNRVKILFQDAAPKFTTPKIASSDNEYQCRPTNTTLAFHDRGALGDSICLPRRELEEVSKIAAAVIPENRNFDEPNFEVVKDADRKINEAESPQKPFGNTDKSNAFTPNENWHEYKPDKAAATVTDAMRSEEDSNRTGNLRLSEKDSSVMLTSSVSSELRTFHHHIEACPKNLDDKDEPNVPLLTSIQEGAIGIETTTSEQMLNSSPEKCETTERFNYDAKIEPRVEGYGEVGERIPMSADGTLISPTEKPTSNVETEEGRCSENHIKLSIVSQDESSFLTMEDDVNKNGTDKPLESFENQPDMNTVKKTQMPDSVTLMNTEKHVMKQAETEQQESNERKSIKKNFKLQGILGSKTKKEVPGHEETKKKIEHQSPSTQDQPKKQINTLSDTTTNQELDNSQIETSVLFNSVVKSSVSDNDLVRKDEVSGPHVQSTNTVAGLLISSEAPDFRKNTGDQPIDCLKHETTDNLMSPRRNNSNVIASDDAPSLPTNQTPEKLVPLIVTTEARRALLATTKTTDENTQTGDNTKTDNGQFRLEGRTCTENDESKPVIAEAVFMGTEPLYIRSIQKDNAQVELKSDPSSTVALAQVGKSKEPFTKGLDYPDSRHFGHVRMNNAETPQPEKADLPSKNMLPSVENSLIRINRNDHAYSNDDIEVSHEVPAIVECDIGQDYESEAIPDFVPSTQVKEAQDTNMPISLTDETAEVSTVPLTVDSFSDNAAESTAQPTAQPKTLLGSHGSLNPPVITVQLEPPSLTPNDVNLHVKSPKNRSKLRNLFGKKNKTEDNKANSHKKSENHDSEFTQQETDKPKKRILKNIFRKKKKSNIIPQLGTNSTQPELLQPGTPSSSSGTGSLSITRFDASISSISDESCTGKSWESSGPAPGVISSNLETPVLRYEHNLQKPVRNKRLNDFPISEETSYDESLRPDPREQPGVQTVTANASDQPITVNIEGRDDLVNTNLPEYSTSTLQSTNANESVSPDDDSKFDLTEVRAMQHDQEILQANEEEGDVCSTDNRKSSTVDDSIMRTRALMPTADEPEFDMNESDKISDHGSTPAPASNSIPAVQEEFGVHTEEITQQSVPTELLAGLPHDRALDMSFESSIATSSGISESERSESESKKRPQKKKSLLKMKNPFRKDKYKDTSDTEKYTSKSPINTLAEKMPSGLVSLFSNKKKNDDSSLTIDREQVTSTTPKEKKKTKLYFLRKKQVKSVDSETDEEAIKPSQQAVSLLSPAALPTPNLTSYETSDDQYESDASVMKAGFFSQHDSSSGMSTATLSDVSQKTLCMDWKVSNTMRAHYMRLAWESILEENLACMCINSGTSWSYYAVVKGVVWPIKLKFGRCTYVKVVVTSSDKIRCRQMGEVMRQVIVRKKTPQCRSRAKHLWRHLTQYLQTRNVGVLVFTTDDVNRWGLSLPTSGQYCYTNWENYLYFAWLP